MKIQKSKGSRRAWGEGGKGRHVAGPGVRPKRMVGVNERGMRVGQDNPAAVLTDHDVELVFELRELGWGYGRIAGKLECSKSLVRKIVKGEARAQHPVRYKLVA